MRFNGVLLVSEISTKICENLLDTLDRLFDRDSQVIDVYALVLASSEALKDSLPELGLSGIAIELDKISKNGKPEELQREEALRATNNLRVALSDFLSI
jgi:hypothetical protein